MLKQFFTLGIVNLGVVWDTNYFGYIWLFGNNAMILCEILAELGANAMLVVSIAA
jgi:hypothetical protein